MPKINIAYQKALPPSKEQKALTGKPELKLLPPERNSEPPTKPRLATIGGILYGISVPKLTNEQQEQAGKATEFLGRLAKFTAAGLSALKPPK